MVLLSKKFKNKNSCQSSFLREPLHQIAEHSNFSLGPLTITFVILDFAQLSFAADEVNL